MSKLCNFNTKTTPVAICTLEMKPTWDDSYIAEIPRSPQNDRNSREVLL